MSAAGEERLAMETERLKAAYARRSDNDARYSFFDPGHLLHLQQRERMVLQALRRHGFFPLSGLRVLEVGCGTGAWARDLVRWGLEPRGYTGVDVLPARLEEARRLSPPGAVFSVTNGAALEFADAGFDLVLQATVFTSILDAHVRVRVAREMLRVLRPGGAVLWYDYLFNNPRNPDVRAVGRKELAGLFPERCIMRRRLTLAPPLARRLARVSPFACELLQRVPWLCTHYLAVIA
jgi:ubiquinone/menaquinone biosynthesis C-methylase UbiE